MSDVYEEASQYQRPAKTAPKRRPNPKYDDAGQRIRKVHKPWKRRGCQYVPSIGWVWNPGGQEIS